MWIYIYMKHKPRKFAKIPFWGWEPAPNIPCSRGRLAPFWAVLCSTSNSSCPAVEHREKNRWKFVFNTFARIILLIVFAGEFPIGFTFSGWGKLLGWRSWDEDHVRLSQQNPSQLPSLKLTARGLALETKCLGPDDSSPFWGPMAISGVTNPRKIGHPNGSENQDQKKNGFLREPSHKRKHRGKTCPKPIPCVYGIFTSMNTQSCNCHVGTYSIHGWYGQTNQPKKPLTSFFFQETSLRFTKSFHTAIQVDAHTRVSSTWEASNSSKRFGRATYLLKNIQLKRLKFISTKVCHVLSFLTRFWCWNLQFYKIYSKHPCFLRSRSECIYTAQHLRKEIPLTFSRNPLKKPWPIYL